MRHFTSVLAHNYVACLLVDREIDIGECEDVQQARLGLLKKSSVDIVSDWDYVDEVCEKCDYRQW
jgi:hypothetical protein